jgi:D-arginine dehydrogenase
MEKFDVIVIGAGIAGASAAYELAADQRVLVLERESAPGYHSSGRSAALFHDTYGKGPVVKLTRASRAFYENPPPGFTETPLLSPRGVLIFGTAEQRPRLEAAQRESAAAGVPAHLLSGEAARELVPVLRADHVVAAVHEPLVMDLDANGIHQGYLKGLRQRGGKVVTDADVTGLKRRGAEWAVDTSAGSFAAPVVVNAAGAWGDEMARLAGVRPVGLSPKRRTAFMVATEHDAARWPAAIDCDEGFYIKPEAGLLLASPANEDAMVPHDVQPDEMDIAIAVDRIETATTLQVRKVGRKWAGLRSFVADRVMVAGFEPDAPGFFWLVGQGGYGFQTGPALARVTAGLVAGRDLPDDVKAFGLTRADLAPERPGLVREFAY